MSVDGFRALLLLSSYTDWFTLGTPLEYLVSLTKILRILISCRLFSRVIDMKFVTSLCHSKGEFSGPLRAHICWPQDR